ncbi:MAG: DUF262 domain-containing protein [Paracoccaceae bacterium]
MNNDLLTISKLFTEKLFRIPDYQRGYAWTNPQLEDFWLDLNQINMDSNHYTGVITLEPVPRETYDKWEDDRWIIKSKSFTPYYLVDGQQRISTTIILIQCIAESLQNPEDILNFTTKHEIQRRFIFDTKDGDLSKSYIFGYERDNPSYEYLKTVIFGETSTSDRQEETVYTNNLSNAKCFFLEKLSGLDHDAIERLYSKVTQKLLFNIFTISEEVDVCVAFETMNNRGKPLSYLELLKNRLIYLSTKLTVENDEASSLRKTINNSWKTIYHNLGRNKSLPLDDDFFLRTHHFINYLDPISDGAPDREMARLQSRYHRAIDAPEYRNLLNEIFTFSGLVESRKGDAEADAKALKSINSYAISLQKAVKEWYSIFNPQATNDPTDHRFWLSKINKIASSSVYPILLSVMLATGSNDLRTQVFKELERLLFVERFISPTYYRSVGSFDLLSASINLHKASMSITEFITNIRTKSESLLAGETQRKQLRESFRNRNFYTWRAIHYFLYEYNLDIQLSSKTDREKIDWNIYAENERDFESIEHIYPQQATNGYWRENFKGLSANQRDLLRNAIGNLLPLSKRKNASLSNKPYPDKVKGRTHGVGYVFGSYAENEVASTYDQWTPNCILDRTLRLLDFLEVRWDVDLGTDAEKTDLIGLGFIPSPKRISERRHTLIPQSHAKSTPRKPAKVSFELK